MTLAEFLELQNRPLEEALKIMVSRGLSVKIVGDKIRVLDSVHLPESKD